MTNSTHLERFRRLSLEALLAWGFGALIVGGLLAAGLAFAVWRAADGAFDEYEKQDAPIAMQASKGVDAWLKTRRDEERFMLSASGVIGPAEAKARYIPLWQSSADDIRNYLKQIRRLGDESDRRVLDILPPIETAFESYATSFISTADAVVQLGNGDSGLDAEMKAKLRSAESMLTKEKSPALSESLLNLGRIRMEFALNGKEQSIQDFTEEAARFDRLASGSSRQLSLRDTIKAYSALFADFVRLSREREAKKLAFIDAAARVESGLEQLEQEALQNTHGTLLAFERRLIGMTQSAAVIASIAVVLGAVIAAFVAGRIRVAAQRVIGFAGRVAAGRLETRLTRVGAGEFGALESALNTMADRLQENDDLMNRQARSLEASNRRIALLSEMTGLLQTAISPGEAEEISAKYLSRMQLARGGALYLYNESRNHLDLSTQWGVLAPVKGFAPDDCWALRRGQAYGSIEGESALICKHSSHEERSPYLCLPMVSQEGMLGLFHITFERDSVISDEETHFARRLAEELGLALANLKLRETLRAQSLTDALTGLFNRRFLDESLIRELARAARDKTQIAILMIDADHFKRYNDSHGHEAGDAALRQLGRVLKGNCRGVDLACRYGGEEFTVVLPGNDAEGARVWAERLLERVRSMQINLHGMALPGLTVSIGLALYPENGEAADAVLHAADAALYEAKQAGRNQIVIKGK